MSDDPRQHLRLHRESATGLSFLHGEPVTAVADLPDCRIEVHVFDDANTAGGFVAGLDCASKNALAWTWEPGRRLGNRSVIVARFDHERPGGPTIADVVGLVVHPRNSFESNDHAAAMNEIHAEREQRYVAERERSAPLRAALEAAGIAVHDAAMLWARFGNGMLVDLMPDGSYRVECSVHLHRVNDDRPLLDLYAEHFAGLGFTFDPDEPFELAAMTAETPEAAVALAQRMMAACEGLPPIAKAFWHERFMATMKMTPRLCKFLAEGANYGLNRYWSRKNLSLTAGGITIKQTEIDRLRRAGWLTYDGSTDVVSAEGLRLAVEVEMAERRRKPSVYK